MNKVLNLDKIRIFRQYSNLRILLIHYIEEFIWQKIKVREY